MWRSLLDLEEQLFVGSADSKINEKHFLIITKWITVNCIRFKQSFRTESLAKCLLVRYFNLENKIEHKDYQIIASGCLYLSSLVVEYNTIEIDDFIKNDIDTSRSDIEK